MLLLVAGAALAADQPPVPVRTVDGNLDARARLQTLHAEMRHECGASPGSARCQRLKRAFQQQARNYHKQHRR